jgi:hypothetical protein
LLCLTLLFFPSLFSASVGGTYTFLKPRFKGKILSQSPHCFPVPVDQLPLWRHLAHIGLASISLSPPSPTLIHTHTHTHTRMHRHAQTHRPKHMLTLPSASSPRFPFTSIWMSYLHFEVRRKG